MRLIFIGLVVAITGASALPAAAESAASIRQRGIADCYKYNPDFSNCATCVANLGGSFNVTAWLNRNPNASLTISQRTGAVSIPGGPEIARVNLSTGTVRMVAAGGGNMVAAGAGNLLEHPTSLITDGGSTLRSLMNTGGTRLKDRIQQIRGNRR